MATTRYYLPVTGTAAHSPAASAFWTDKASIVRRAAVTTKIASAMTSLPSGGFGTGAGYYGQKYQWVSAALSPYEWTTADSIKLQVRLSGGGSPNNIQLAVSVRIMYSTTSIRGTLYEGKSSVYADPDTLTNTNLGSAHVHVQNAVSQSNGDHLVIEVGNYSVANGSMYWNFGDDSATDLGENVTDTAAYNPWIEFTTADAAATENNVLFMTFES